MTENKNNFLAYKEILHSEMNTTLMKVSLYSAILGFSGSVILYCLTQLQILKNIEVPIWWTLFGGTNSILIFLLAYLKKIKGWITYFVILNYISFPTIIYIIAHYKLPSGTATYITGPPSYLYFFMIIISGFAFNSRLATFAGAIAGIEYFIFYYIDSNHFSKLNSTDSLMIQDMTEPSIYFFKSIMMFFSGLGIGIFCNNSNRFMNRILKEELEKTSISRLFGQFVSDEIKDKIISDKKGLAGEKKEVAILFSDIRGFSTLSETYPPEIMVTLLNEYLDKMVYCITKHGGVIDKFIGDAIMAVFGGVMDMENPSANALNASIDMQKELISLNTNFEKRNLPQLQNGIGIHFGDVIQGTIGSQNRKDFTVIGDTVNTASRIESLTKNYDFPILISESIFQKLSLTEQEKFISLGNVSVKGKKTEVNLFGRQRE